MTHMRRSAALSLLLLSGCAGGPGVALQPQPADPAIVAKINYVCAYSGLFKFADSLAASVIPVPGLSLGVNLLNQGVDKICLNPTAIAATEATVVNLIAQFRAAGKM